MDKYYRTNSTAYFTNSGKKQNDFIKIRTITYNKRGLSFDQGKNSRSKPSKAQEEARRTKERRPSGPLCSGLGSPRHQRTGGTRRDQWHRLTTRIEERKIPSWKFVKNEFFEKKQNAELEKPPWQPAGGGQPSENSGWILQPRVRGKWDYSSGVLAFFRTDFFYFFLLINFPSFIFDFFKQG